MKTITAICLLLLSFTANAATPLQRELSLNTALKDAAPTTQERTDVVAAFVAQLTDDEIRARYGVERAALTNQQSAAIYLRALGQYVKATSVAHRERLLEAEHEAERAAARAAGNAVIVTPED